MANGLLKRGKFWVYDFQYLGKRHQGSTHHTNKEAAAAWLRAFRTNLVNEGVGLVTKEPAPILSVFLEGSFLSDVRQNAKTPNTRKFYEQRVKCLTAYSPFTKLTLDKVGELHVQAYKDFRIQKNMAVASINAELRVLRKAMIYAQKCGFGTFQKISSLPGEKRREFVLTGEMEKAYLAIAPWPLKHAAILMLDLGLRPSEAVSLRKSAIDGRSVAVITGKTVNAKRTLPQTQRTREALKLCAEFFPDSPWVFPGLKGNHYSRVALGALHRKTCGDRFPKTFVLHSCRHTCATRWAESGMDVFTLSKLMGHSSIKISERYVHIASDYASLAMKRAEAYGRLLRGESEESLQKSDILERKP